MQYYYEQLQAKGIDATNLPLDLAYSIEYNASLERLCGMENVTFKPVEENKN